MLKALRVFKGEKEVDAYYCAVDESKYSKNSNNHVFLRTGMTYFGLFNRVAKFS